MKLRRFFAVFVAVAFAVQLRAQKADGAEIKGTVVAGDHPVEYATLTLKTKPAGRVMQSTATDARGAFGFEQVPSGDYEIVYAIIGGESHTTRTFTVDAQHRTIDLGALPLGESALKMEKVEVSARRDAFYNSIDRKVYNVGKDLQSASGSASDLLQNVPSVQVDIDGNVSLRGNDSVLVLVNGKPSTLMSATNRPDVLAQMPADSIERIEVITNPSAKYKPDGTAGIINLVLKRKHDSGTSGVVRVNVGNDSRSNVSISANYNPGKYNLFGTVSVRQDDRERFATETRRHLDAASNTFLGTEQTSREHMRPLSRLAQAGFDYQPNERDKFGATASYNLRTFYRDAKDGNLSRDATGAVAGDYDRLRADNEWQKTTEASATYEHNFADEDHDLSIELKRDRHWEQESNRYTNVYRVPLAPSSLDSTLVKPTETGTELTADYAQPFENDAKLEAGYAGEENKDDMDFRGGFFDPASSSWLVDAARTNRFIYRDSIQALYATFGRPIGKFGILAGLRVEHTTVHTNQVTTHLTDAIDYNRVHPTLHLSYNLTDARQLQLNYSHRVRRPESDDLNPFPEYQDPFNLRAGNPRLRPEEAHSIEAGYQYRKDDTTYLAALYFRETYHAFTTVTRYIDAVTLLTTHENLSTNRSGGLELTATTKLGSKLSLNSSANAYRSEIDATNLGFSDRRSTIAWDAKLNLEWRATKSDLVQLNANYSAKRLTAQGYRLPTEIANLGWRHDFAGKNFAFTLTVSDLFDSLKERTVIDTPTLHDDITRRRSSRIVYAGFSYNFGRAAKKKKDDGLQFDNSL
ncbi:MAG TPA: TonB-dependent receptor [Opitutaceae bacterium]|nr:TonB-dependent receptor [Opitutaceae bacterium]